MIIHRTGSASRAALRRTGGAPLAAFHHITGHVTLSEARSRLYQRRFLQLNTHFSTFFDIYKMYTPP